MNTLTILNNNDDITLSTAELFYNRYKNTCATTDNLIQKNE